MKSIRIPRFFSGLMVISLVGVLASACGDDDSSSSEPDGGQNGNAGNAGNSSAGTANGGSGGSSSDAGNSGGAAQVDAGEHHDSMCEVLGHLCHELDDGGDTLAHECHEVGHAGDEAACAEKYPVCISLCAPEQAGDAGAALCEEMGHACHELDDGGATLAHECHETGHAGNVVACALIYDECMELCGGEHHHEETDAGDAG